MPYCKWKTTETLHLWQNLCYILFCRQYLSVCFITSNCLFTWFMFMHTCGHVTVLPFIEWCCWSSVSTWRIICGLITVLMQQMLTYCPSLSWWMKSFVKESQHGRSAWSLLSCSHSVVLLFLLVTKVVWILQLTAGVYYSTQLHFTTQ